MKELEKGVTILWSERESRDKNNITGKERVQDALHSMIFYVWATFTGNGNPGEM